MGYETEQVAAELAFVDERIATVRSELMALKDLRAELVERLEECIGPGGRIRLRTRTALVDARARRRVGFPTKQGDPDARDALIRSLRSIGRYEEFSTLNYAKLKSDWLNDKCRGRVRRAIRPFADESSELLVRCRPLEETASSTRGVGIHQ